MIGNGLNKLNKLNMKQTIEIEVPEGKKVIFENNQIIFVDEEPHWK